MQKENQLDLVVPDCRVLQLKIRDDGLQVVGNFPSVHDASAAVGVKPRTVYTYCRRIGKKLRGSYFMAY